MNREMLKNNAEAFLKASERCLEKKYLKTGTEWLSVPAVVNLAFSIELYLKYILTENTDIIKKHTLDDLFDLLGDLDRIKIIEASKIEEKIFYKQLKLHSEIFVDWRYLHETTTDKKVDFDFLNKFIIGIKFILI